MKTTIIAILAIQETHLRGMHDFNIFGYSIMLSGSTTQTKIGRNFSGVGFIIAPEVQPAVIGFRAVSYRIAELRLRVPRGTLQILSVYAPHSGRSYDIRKHFFDELLSCWKSPNLHSCTMVLGDFNAKLYHRLPGEEEVLGDYVFDSPFSRALPTSSRELLLEACMSMNAVVGNTFFQNSVDALVTYYSLGAKPMDDITPQGFSQIDFCLLDQQALKFVQDIRISLASRHFMVIVSMHIQYEKTVQQAPKVLKESLHMLSTSDEARKLYCDQFCDAMQSAIYQNLDEHGSAISTSMCFATIGLLFQFPPRRRPWILDFSLQFISR